MAALLSLVSGGMLPACNPQADPAQLATVQRMIQATDSLRTALEQADTNALRHMEALFAAERPAIEARFGDTLLPNEAGVLGNYHRSMAERLPALLALRQMEQGRLDSTRSRLEDLRHDLEQGLLDGPARETALAMEKRWIQLLRQETDSIRRHTRQLIDDRTAWRATIDSLLHP